MKTAQRTECLLAVGAMTVITSAASGQSVVAAWGQLSFITGRDPFPSVSDATQAAVGESHIIALRSDGSIVAAGGNRFGETGVPTGISAKAIACGRNHTAALTTDNKVVCWGDKTYGQCNADPSWPAASAIACGEWSTFVLTVNGDTRAIGYCNNIPYTSVSKICAGGQCVGVIRSNGRAYASEAGAAPPTDAYFTEIDVWTQGGGSGGWGIGIRTTGAVALWGYLANHSLPNLPSPAVRVSCGPGVALILMADGRIESVGYGLGGTDIPPLDRGPASQCELSTDTWSLSAVGVFSASGVIGTNCPSDLDGSGQVDTGDVAMLLLDFGPCQ
jgi:hypothetical protein